MRRCLIALLLFLALCGAAPVWAGPLKIDPAIQRPDELRALWEKFPARLRINKSLNVSPGPKALWRTYGVVSKLTLPPASWTPAEAVWGMGAHLWASNSDDRSQFKARWAIYWRLHRDEFPDPIYLPKYKRFVVGGMPGQATQAYGFGCASVANLLGDAPPYSRIPPRAKTLAAEWLQ